MQIQDLAVTKEIDMAAVRGGSSGDLVLVGPPIYRLPVIPRTFPGLLPPGLLPIDPILTGQPTPVEDPGF